MEKIINFIELILTDKFEKFKNNQLNDENIKKSVFYKQLSNNHDYK